MRFQRFIQPALVATIAVTSLAACGARQPRTFDQLDVKPVTHVVSARPLPSPTIAADGAIAFGDWLRAEQMRSIVAFARAAVPDDRRSATNPPVVAAAVLAPPSIASVMACIRGAESGNYGESANPQAATGAYQYEGATWRTWSARAGYPGYEYAYLAPPSVQDAVTAYALTHGGAGNWSPRYGADSCTVGIGG